MQSFDGYGLLLGYMILLHPLFDFFVVLVEHFFDLFEFGLILQGCALDEGDVEGFEAELAVSY